MGNKSKSILKIGTELPEVRVTAFNRNGLTPYQKIKARDANPYEYMVSVNPLSETDVHFGLNGSRRNGNYSIRTYYDNNGNKILEQETKYYPYINGAIAYTSNSKDGKYVGGNVQLGPKATRTSGAVNLDTTIPESLLFSTGLGGAAYKSLSAGAKALDVALGGTLGH